MATPSFYNWLSTSLHSGNVLSLPQSGFSKEEQILAKEFLETFKKNSQYRQYANAYLESLDGTESLYEGAIKTFSATIKIIQLTSRKDRCLDLGAVCREILEIVTRELDMENCSIMLRSEDGEGLELIAGKGKGDRYQRGETVHELSKRKKGEGIAGMVFKTGEHIFIPDVTADERFDTSNMKVSVKSLLSAPILSNDEIIGVINFSHPHPEVFDHNSINFMLMLANFIGQVITLVELHKKLEEWNLSLQHQVAEKTDELVKKNRKLQRIAVTDPLTSLYNRRFFFTRLEEEFNLFTRYEETFSLMMIDFDNLKPINDNFGHDMGDKVLKRIARIFKVTGRKGDIIGRIGGDEFGYIFLKGDEDEAERFAHRLQEAISHIDMKEEGIKPTVSIGIASVKNSKFLEHLDLYRAADRALYDAKKEKNTIRLYNKIV